MSTISSHTAAAPRGPVIIDAVRTPFGKRGGWLSQLHPAALLAHTQRALLDRLRLPADAVEQAIGGCVTQAGEQASNVTRTSWLYGGLPRGTGCTTVDAQCASAQQSLHLLAGLISAGAIDVGMACGVEAMSRVPLMSNIPGTNGRPKPEDWAIDMPNQFVGAERIAHDKGLTRLDLDAFGVRSQQRATAAWDAGAFDRQVVPVTLPQGIEPAEGAPRTVSRDQGLRASTAADLAALQPVVDGGSHTAATSSQITDGAAAAVICSAEAARRHGLRPRGRLVAQALVGGDPYYHLDGPIQAAERVLERSGMAISDMSIIEVNEAFAAVPLSFQRHFEVPDERLNPLGGAIAIGHPVGATGLRLIANVLDELERTDSSHGMVAICAGGALASAAIIERL